MNREQIQKAVNEIERALSNAGIAKGSVNITFTEENDLSEEENTKLASESLSGIQGEMGILGCKLCCKNGGCGICCEF